MHQQRNIPVAEAIKDHTESSIAMYVFQAQEAVQLRYIS